MPVASVVDFVEEVLRLQVLTSPQRTELQTDLAPRLADAKKVAAELIKRGWLTPFQVNHIFPGRTGELMLGPYVLQERIGEGGMGQVYKAIHTVLRRVDAVKVLRITGHRPGEAIPRFLQEAVAAGKVGGRHLVGVYTADRSADCIYLAMEFIDGSDLGKVIHAHPNGMSVVLACDYTRQAAMGLGHAHERGLIHRDIKPSNLIVARDGVVKVLDLGLARVQDDEQTSTRLTRPGSVMGTPDYMSPEQINNIQSVDERSDIYSLGCTFYHLLTGSTPYPQGTMMEKLRQHCESEPTSIPKLRPDVPAEVVAIVRKMMERLPEDRHQDCGEIVAALAPFCDAPTAVSIPSRMPPTISPGQETSLSQSLSPTEQRMATVEGNSGPRPTPRVIEHERTSPEAMPLSSASPNRRKLVFAAGGGLAALLLVLLFVKILSGDKEPSDKDRQASKDADKKSDDKKPDDKKIEDDKPTLIVDPSGPGPRTIRDAINQAGPGTRIRIKPGVYKESLILHKSLELVGDGPVESVVIQGVVSDAMVCMAPDVIVRKLTLRGRTGMEKRHFAVDIADGHTLLDECVIENDSLACVSARGKEGLRATIRRCTFRASGAGGVLAYDKAEALVEDCDIQGNEKSAVEVQNSAILTCKRCKFHDGEATGALAVDDGTLTLEGCEVWGNKASGVALVDRCKAKLTKCTLRDGKSFGVLIQETQDVSVEECEIHGNALSGIKITMKANPRIRNCDLHEGYMGLFCDKDATGVVEECQFWSHKSSEVGLSDGGNTRLIRCKIRDGEKAGVTSAKKGKGTLEMCELYGHKGAAVVVFEEGDLILKECEIHDTQDVGVKIFDKGHVLLDRCKVYGVVKTGLAAGKDGKATIRGGEIVRNGYFGVVANDMAEIDVEGCDLRNNASGAWHSDPNAKMTRKNTKE